jgi:hypothetical protein
LPSWWFSWKNCHFVGRFFDFVIILRPITMYQDYLFLATAVATVRLASEEASSMDGWQDGFRGCFTPPAQKFSYIDNDLHWFFTTCELCILLYLFAKFSIHLKHKTQNFQKKFMQGLLLCDQYPKTYSFSLITF